jgi:hypothetical protein
MSVQFFAQVKGNIHLTEFSCNIADIGQAVPFFSFQEWPSSSSPTIGEN